MKNNPIPNHVAIIQDGNRRYAYRQGHSAYRGHKEGVSTTKKILKVAREVGVTHLTVYALSTENLNRDEKELNDLFSLFEKEFSQITENPDIHRNRVRVRVIGSTDLLPKKVHKAVQKAEEATENYSQHYLNIAIAYGSKTEIADAARQLSRKTAQNELQPGEINHETISSHLYPAHLDEPSVPDVDLMIRTGGNQRLSNFLMWQSCGNNSAVYFSDHLWPEFSEKEFKKAVKKYQEIETEKQKPTN
ncbi:polyprenyl diphosphate synthase [Methanonatronarchaeum sp. AMET6-2]|uniref:polyprenyl diphosphate synthase n=1 Tax=Methanonatronarchaeum sp. AMET6-2 TaxID=2933293 RepID=UPI001FF36FD2|nr:polyprenyl diphosphate synthase [Methanonatronarchaeum sp. AMET6-2]UOY10245.1 polyprenyl diphosphate synthase [Methanonatronarchaeum sp. AMET6-2]